MVKASIVGARGYLGRELVRILLEHPEVEEVVPVSRSAAGTPFGDHVPTLRHRTDLVVAGEDAACDADVVFLATPKGEAARFAEEAGERGCRLVVDLSRDHRIDAIAGTNGWTYGLADVHPVARGTSRVANPGCYPTASLLAAWPALKAGLADKGPILVDGKSGVSGAGVRLNEAFHYARMNESLRAYNVVGHDHTEEIAAFAGTADGGQRPVRFTPHLIPQTRGLLSTVHLVLSPEADGDAVQATYRQAYHDRPFVRVVDEADTAHVRGSNHADVAVDVDPDTGFIIARCAIDNLVKGGSGTAVQNMNDALGHPTETGLERVGGSP